MRRHADLRSRKIECDLDHDDHSNVCQSLFRMRRVAMSHQKSCPGADYAHNTARRTDQLNRVDETN